MKHARIIMGALILGVAIFALLLVAVYGLSFNAQLSTISIIALAIGFLLMVNAIVLPGIVGRSLASKVGARMKDVEKSERENQAILQLMNAWFSHSIIGAAMLEAAAFLNLIVMFPERNAIHLVAAAVMMALMVNFFPFEHRVVQWIEDRLNER